MTTLRTAPRGIALLLAAASLLLASPPAHALDCDSDSPDAVCQITTVGGLVFEALRGDIVDPTNDDFIEVEGDLWLVTEVLLLPFLNGYAQFERDANGDLWLEVAKAEAPLSGLPLFDSLTNVEPPSVLVGMGGRETVRALLEDPDDPKTVLPLSEVPNPDDEDALVEPVYLFFRMQMGPDVALEMPFPELEDALGQPLEISLREGLTTTFVLDPQEPFLYVSNEGRNGLIDRYEDEQKKRKKKAEKRRMSAEEKKKAREKAAAKKAKKAKKESKKKDEKASKKKDKKKKDKDIPKGAFAISWEGGIPASAYVEQSPILGATDLAGFLFIRFPVPLAGLVTMDGDTVYSVQPDGLGIAGAGDAVVGLPVAGSLLGLSLPLGSARATLELDADVQRASVVGLLEPDTSDLDKWIPVLPKTTIEVEAALGTRLEDNLLRMYGKFGIDLEPFSELAGVDIGEPLTLKGDLRIDESGFLLQGRARPDLHPAIGIDGKVDVDASFTGDPADAFLRIAGALSVGGIDLGAGASLEVDARGAFVEGAFSTGRTEIALAGELGRQGPVLLGSLALPLPLDILEQELENARQAVRDAEVGVDRIDDEIDDMRDTVRAERRAASSALADAQSAVNGARGRLDDIQDDIDDNDDDIDRYEDKIDDLEDKKCRSVSCFSERAADIAYYKGLIAARKADNVTLKARRTTARTTLSAAEAALARIRSELDALPTDTDPRIVALFGQREAAEGTLAAARIALDAVPDTSGLPDDLLVRIDVRLDERGLSGTATAEGSGVEVAEASVAFGASPEACVVIAAAGEVCASF